LRETRRSHHQHTPHAPANKVYPGAAHGFDVCGLLRCSASGHLLSENPEAAADSFAMTEAFVAPRLKAK
jgi:dienelactone hydrolase